MSDSMPEGGHTENEGKWYSAHRIGESAMPEPDFDQIAHAIVHEPFTVVPRSPADAVKQIADQLRQVWNARGAADRGAVDHELSWMRDTLTAAEPSIEKLDLAIRSLDR